MLAVVMGSPTYKERNKEASMLMNYGFSKYTSIDVVKKENDIEKINLNKAGDKFLWQKHPRI